MNKKKLKLVQDAIREQDMECAVAYIEYQNNLLELMRLKVIEAEVEGNSNNNVKESK